MTEPSQSERQWSPAESCAAGAINRPGEFVERSRKTEPMWSWRARAVVAALRSKGMLKEEENDHPLDPGPAPRMDRYEGLLSAIAVIQRAATGETERIDLDLGAYREGRIEPPLSVRNGDTFSFQESYA